MITRNGTLILGQGCIGKTNIPANTLRKYNGDIRQYEMNASYVYIGGASTDNISDTFYNYKMVMNLGLGNTAPSESDYTLASTMVGDTDINEIIVCKNAEMSIDNSGKITFSYTFKEKSGLSFTIREIGVSLMLNDMGKYLIARRVLSTPRVVQALETVTFEYSLSF